MTTATSIQIEGLPETSSRITLKREMDRWGEVIGCHMGTRSVDLPIVRFKTRDQAEKVVAALKAGEIIIDHVVIKGSISEGGKVRIGDMPSRPYQQSLDFTSRDLIAAVKKKYQKKSGKSRSRSKKKQKKGYSRSRSRGDLAAVARRILRDVLDVLARKESKADLEAARAEALRQMGSKQADSGHAQFMSFVGPLVDRLAHDVARRHGYRNLPEAMLTVQKASRESASKRLSRTLQELQDTMLGGALRTESGSV